MITTNESTKCITKHPVISKKLNQKEMRLHALLVALGVVYYMRLNSNCRESFIQELDNMHLPVKFLTAFTEEVVME